METKQKEVKKRLENNVDLMTSREFRSDPKSCLDSNKFIIKDKVRFMQYMDAFISNRHLFLNKTVLDVECGMGMLSLIAAKAGAAKVYAVDKSNVTHYTRRVVEENKYIDVVEVIHSSIEDLELPCKVDIIVSDWMGYGLLFQSCADAVITARDKWLKKGGFIFPNKAHLFLVAIENSKYRDSHLDWWNNIYGFKMHVFRNWILSEPICQQLHPIQIISSEYFVTTIDLYSANIKDLQYQTKFKLHIDIGTRVDAFATYFEVVFKKLHKPVRFSTSPFWPQTAWMQQVYNLDQPFYAQAGDELYGGIQMKSTEEKFDRNKMSVAIDVFKGHPSTSPMLAAMRYKLDADVGQPFYFGENSFRRSDKKYKM